MHLSQVEPVAVEGPDVLVIAAKPGYNRLRMSAGPPRSLDENRTGAPAVDPPAGDRPKYERSAEVEDVASDGTAGRRTAAGCPDGRPAGSEGRRALRGPSAPMEYDEPDPDPPT